MDSPSRARSGKVSSTGCRNELTLCFLVSVSDLAFRTNLFVGLFGVEVSPGLGFSRRAYLKRFILVPSSRCRICILILRAGTLDPCMNRCVACTKVMELLLLEYPHVLEYGCRHFVAMRLSNIFRVSPRLNTQYPITGGGKG